MVKARRRRFVIYRPIKNFDEVFAAASEEPEAREALELFGSLLGQVMTESERVVEWDRWTGEPVKWAFKADRPWDGVIPARSLLAAWLRGKLAVGEAAVYGDLLVQHEREETEYHGGQWAETRLRLSRLKRLFEEDGWKNLLTGNC